MQYFIQLERKQKYIVKENIYFCKNTSNLNFTQNNKIIFFQ